MQSSIPELLENAWSGRDEGEFENDIRSMNAATEYVEAAEELATHVQRIINTKIATDDFWLNDAIDTFNKKSHALRMALLNG